MSEEIIIKHALKKYGENVIIPDLNLDIREGEFFPRFSARLYRERVRLPDVTRWRKAR